MGESPKAGRCVGKAWGIFYSSTLYNGQLTADAYLTLKNSGAVTLQVFTSNDPNVTEILAGETKEGIYADILSDGNGFNWLIVVNVNGIDGTVEIGKE